MKPKQEGSKILSDIRVFFGLMIVMVILGIGLWLMLRLSNG